MFAGETSDSLALANTVVLTRLIEELIRRDIIAKMTLTPSCEMPRALYEIAPSVAHGSKMPFGSSARN